MTVILYRNPLFLDCSKQILNRLPTKMSCGIKLQLLTWPVPRRSTMCRFHNIVTDMICYSNPAITEIDCDTRCFSYCCEQRHLTSCCMLWAKGFKQLCVCMFSAEYDKSIFLQCTSPNVRTFLTFAVGNACHTCNRHVWNNALVKCFLVLPNWRTPLIDGTQRWVPCSHVAKGSQCWFTVVIFANLVSKGSM